MSESRVQRCDYAKDRKDRHIGPIDILESRIAVETIIDAGNSRSPHQDHDSKIVELVAEPLHFWAMVADDVVGCRKDKTNRNAVEEGREDEDISWSREWIAQVQGLVGVDWCNEKDGCTNDVRVYIDGLVMDIAQALEASLK